MAKRRVRVTLDDADREAGLREGDGRRGAGDAAADDENVPGVLHAALVAARVGGGQGAGSAESPDEAEPLEATEVGVERPHMAAAFGGDRTDQQVADAEAMAAPAGGAPPSARLRFHVSREG